MVHFGASNLNCRVKTRVGTGKDEVERMKDESGGVLSLNLTSSFCLHPSSLQRVGRSVLHRPRRGTVACNESFPNQLHFVAWNPPAGVARGNVALLVALCRAELARASGDQKLIERDTSVCPNVLHASNRCELCCGMLQRGSRRQARRILQTNGLKPARHSCRSWLLGGLGARSWSRPSAATVAAGRASG